MEQSFSQAAELILSELGTSLSAVDDAQAKTVAVELVKAGKVFVVGVGRVMLMLQAFAKRLNHLGIPTYFVGEINEPAISAGDVLLAASGSGESVLPVSIAKVALKYRPKIIYIGSNMESTLAGMADVKLRIPCKTKLNLADELSSRQPMSSLFEQSLLMALDAIALMIVRNEALDIEALWMTHANLE